MNITFDSDSVIKQEKNGSEKDRQVNPYDKNESNMSIEENASEIIEENASKKIYFKAYLDNPTQETKLLNTPLGKIITRNLKMGTAA